MAKITITTDRQPWVGGKPRAKGDVIDVSADDASTLVASGFAEVEAPKRVVKKATKDE